MCTSSSAEARLPALKFTIRKPLSPSALSLARETDTHSTSASKTGVSKAIAMYYSARGRIGLARARGNGGKAGPPPTYLSKLAVLRSRKALHNPH